MTKARDLAGLLDASGDVKADALDNTSVSWGDLSGSAPAVSTFSNDSNYVAADGNGNVGIGTTSPTIASSGGGVHIQNGTQSALRLDHYLNGGFEIQSSSGTLNFYSTAASAERLRIDGSGRVTMPSQPRFRVRNSGVGDYTTANSAMAWNTVDFDVGNNFSGSTYTCPVDGLYFFSFSVFANTGHTANVDLLHNGGTIGRAERGDATGGYETIGLSLIFQCSANDTLRLHLNSGQVHTNGGMNFFTGYLIG